MDKYECIFRNDDGNRWSVMVDAESFAHAEEQAKKYEVNNDELIQIVKDYT